MELYSVFRKSSLESFVFSTGFYHFAFDRLLNRKTLKLLFLSSEPATCFNVQRYRNNITAVLHPMRLYWTIIRSCDKRGSYLYCMYIVLTYADKKFIDIYSFDFVHNKFAYEVLVISQINVSKDIVARVPSTIQSQIYYLRRSKLLIFNRLAHPYYPLLRSVYPRLPRKMPRFTPSPRRSGSSGF